MKKLFIFLNAMLLSMAAVWADVNTQVAKLVPDKAGSFQVQVFIPGASPSTPKPLYIDWGDGNGKQYYTLNVSASYFTISKLVSAGVTVRIYNSEITGIESRSPVKAAEIDANGANIARVELPLFKGTRTDLEHLYRSLPNRTGKVKGEITVGSAISGTTYYNPELVHSNLFPVLDMNWEPYEMTNYAKKYDFNWCKSNLIPVAKLNNGGTGSTFSLKVGISYTSVLGAYGALPITCWGSVFETTTVSQNNNYTSPPTHTISGLPVEYTAYIYGAALSHLMIDNLESVFNDVTNATNLRYFSSSGGTATFTRMDLSKNNKLVFVSMNRNQSLAGISINSPDLLLLNVNENHKLNSLVFVNSISKCNFDGRIV